MLMPRAAGPDIQIRTIASSDKNWIRKVVCERWGSEIVVSRNRIHLPHNLSGFICERKHSPLGLITYEIVERSCEIVTLDSFEENRGIGTALIESMIEKAKTEACRRLWLVTTNDNIRAIRFYQKRGFVLAGLHKDTIARARLLKPEIPMRGYEGIPIRDEIEFEIMLKRNDENI
jgi:N-acetylglutamate synthase-like GNAT family acetyltransferase